jgi:hypothetical protein
MFLALSVFGLTLSSDELAKGFLGGILAVCLLVVYFGWWQGKLKQSLIFSGVVMAVAFLTSPLATEEVRWLASGVATGLFFWQFWRLRHSAIKTLLLISVFGLLVFLLLASSPKTNTLTAESFSIKMAVLMLALWLAWVFKSKMLPTMTQKYKRPRVWMAAGLAAVFIFLPAAAVWLEAVEINALPKSPVVRTGAELIDEYKRPWGARHRGIFAVGRIGDPAKRDEKVPSASTWLAYYESRPLGGSLGGRESAWFPHHFAFELEDGTKSGVQGIRGVRQANNWPEGGPRLWMHALRDGDPVVVWAEPAKSTTMSDGAETYSLIWTRMISYGTWEDFLDGYLAGAVRTARVIGWVGFGCLFLPVLPLWWGYRHWRWLADNGSDEAMPDRWKITIK